MALRNGEIVYVNLPAILLELVQLICSETADNFIAIHCDYRDEMLLSQQLYQVTIGRNGTLVGTDFVKCLSKDPVASP